ncbi:plant expansin-like protein [Sclerotinia borealis F-4128]|uniref:Plant expansin-like protein n=1 Tax=Sclerotinia borealis (strain F-4128) TaxID=1432307 RepID=W9C475_SCLBF|nr:plant expansin-like protein [Sclerotinia borealis F-4128]
MFISIKHLATASTILSIAQGAVIEKRALSGQATSYGGNTAGGACSFSTYTLPSNIFGTALSDSNWAVAAQCGRCVSVTGPAGNSITAMITDECPGCGTNHLDLYPDAFTTLGSLSTGILDITWDYIKCPITTPLQLHNKEGVSAYWFSMQVVNAVEGISKLEVSTNGGTTWQGTTRTDYNFFEKAQGFGSLVDVRVTGVSGSTVVVKGVAVTPGSVVTAGKNL